MTATLAAPGRPGTAHRLSHVAEAILTSAPIPAPAVLRRMAGAIRFRVRFA